MLNAPMPGYTAAAPKGDSLGQFSSSSASSIDWLGKANS